MGEKKRKSLVITIGSFLLLLAVLGLLGWFLSVIFEGERPQTQLDPLPEYLAGPQEISFSVKDMKRGLKTIRVDLNQEGREITLLERQFPFKGLLNREGSHAFETKISLDPSKLDLAQGRLDLRIRAWDYSRRKGGDGNLTLINRKMTVDTIPPSIRAVSRLHYVNMGGTGLVVYQTSSDTASSGLYLNELFFQGCPVPGKSQEGLHVCYFACPIDLKGHPEISLWAEDRAGNRSRQSFYYHIRRKRYHEERINLSDSLLRQILKYFDTYPFSKEDSEIEKFLKLNRDLRKESTSAFFHLRQDSSPEQIWDGTWLRQKDSATTGGFGDRRFYYYHGKKVDEQVHLGVDLASLAYANVQASNRGRVILAGPVGIYGNTVVLDHGQGLASVYSHLSKIGVQVGQEVSKGQLLGITGQTGLAGGDHLHFGIMVRGVSVNPIEWWDPHWIRDNITKKLNLLLK